MKKIFKLFLCSALALSTMTSCANLDMDNDGRMTLPEIFARYDCTSFYMASIYNLKPKVTLTYGGTTTLLLPGFCDEAQDASDGQSGIVLNWYKGLGSAASFPLTNKGIDTWEYCYQGIYKCNTFLKNIQDPEVATYPFDPTEKAGWIAQARVMRAYNYLQIIKRYGSCPLFDTPLGFDYDFNVARRASVEEVVDFIINECRLALQTPESEGMGIGFLWRVDETQRSYMTRFMAYAIMSQSALFAASPLHNPDGTSKYTWAKATEICKEALDACLSHGLALCDVAPVDNAALNCYDNYFMTRSDASRVIDKETIMESDTRLKIWSYAGLPIATGAEAAGPGPSQELVDSYDMADGTEAVTGYADDDHLQPIIAAGSTYDENNPYVGRDPRFYASIYYNGCQYKLDNASSIVKTCVGGNCGISDKPTDVRYTRTGYYIRKYNNYRSDKSNSVDGFVPLFRLAELYLNFAEAAYQSAAPDTKFNGMSAVDAVNAVRARVGMPGLPSNISKSDFERRYRKERRVELAFENHRFFDVRRWKILDQTDKHVTGMKITEEGDKVKYERIKLADRLCNSDKFLLFPIAQSEINKMQIHTGTSWQNPGW